MYNEKAYAQITEKVKSAQANLKNNCVRANENEVEDCENCINFNVHDDTDTLEEVCVNCIHLLWE